jgi:branched-chain amino acid transport system substrate-binding protein
MGETGAEISVESMYGVMLAVEEINAAGGINGKEVELIIKSDENDGNKAVEVDQELIDQQVIGIIGHSFSSMGKTVLPFINEKEVIMISPTMSSSAFSDQIDWFYSVTPTTKYQSLRISEAIKSDGSQKIGVLYQLENLVYSKQMVEDLKFYLQNDIEVVFEETFSITDSNGYRDSVLNLAFDEIDSLVIMGSNYDIASFAQLLEFNDSSYNVYIPTWGMGEVLLDNAGEKVEGVFAVGAFDHNSQSEAYLIFKEKYINKYGEQPTFASMYGYEAAQFLFLGLEKSNKMDKYEVKEVLDTIEKFQGLQEVIEMDSDGDSRRKMYLMKVIKDDFERVDENEK